MVIKRLSSAAYLYNPYKIKMFISGATTFLMLFSHIIVVFLDKNHTGSIIFTVFQKNLN